MWVNIVLPVADLALSYIHSFFLLHLIWCFAVSNDVGMYVCWSDAPCLASLPAHSFPGMFACPGIRWSVSSTLWSVMKLSLSEGFDFCVVYFSANQCNKNDKKWNLTKIMFIGQKLCSVARMQTDRHGSEYRWHPFWVWGIFPSSYH